MSVAYIALGANLGDRLATLRLVVERLNELGSVEAASSVYETEPVGFADQPSYLNAVVRLRTVLEPAALMAALLEIEAEFGRVRTFANAPRPLDLDLLLYDELTLESTTVTVPHPRLHERAFVLAPMAELAPDLVVPRVGQSVAALLADLDDSQGVQRLDERLD